MILVTLLHVCVSVCAMAFTGRSVSSYKLIAVSILLIECKYCNERIADFLQKVSGRSSTKVLVVDTLTDLSAMNKIA